MATWTAPSTWAAAATVTAAQLNTQLRDNMLAIGQAWTAWTPTVTAETGTFTTVSGSGQYVAAGKLIIWNLSIVVTTVGTATNGLRFTLPVTARASTGYVGNGRSTAGAAAQVILASTTLGHAVKYDNTGIIAVGTHLFSGCYEAA